jgi:hypothetical protein
LKLDKLIKDRKLIERLDKIDPDNASGTKNDGINYWKGKKIITLAEWKKKFARYDPAYPMRTVVQNTKEAVQYYPDDYEKLLLPLGVPDEEMEVVTRHWVNQYFELMRFRNNSKFGRWKCFNCLLCPDKEKEGNHLGLRRLVASILEVSDQEKEEDDNFDTSTATNTQSTQSLYPCPVLNRFKCPYDRQEMEKKPTTHHQQQVTNEDSNSYDVDYLITLGAYCSMVESAIIKATKENSIVPIRSLEEIYNALTDRETLDKLLQQELKEKYLKFKDEMVECFMSIKESIRMEDLTFSRHTNT